MKPRTRAALCGLLTLVCWVIGSSRALAAGCDIKLSWTAPTAYTDGRTLTPATDLAGFNIYENDGTNTTKTNVADPSATSYTLTAQPFGSYTFTATAIDKATGTESAMSNNVSYACVSHTPKRPTLLQAMLAFVRRVFHTLFG